MTLYPTKTEREMLLHRLGIPDAIIEAHTDCDDPPFTEQELMNAIECIEAMVQCGKVTVVTDVEKEVLHDLIDGSTWFASMEREDSVQKFTAHAKIARDLADKVSQMIGRKVRFPLA